jgi:hypothetical protein
MKKLFVLASVLAFSASTLLAGEKALVHCFAYTVIESATPEDWAAFAKATDELPSKIPGLVKVWQGKLARPLGVYQIGQLDAETRKKLQAGEEVTAPVKMLRRQNGVCMVFESAEALAAYAKHPAHDAWMKAYEKVRVYGTTTYDILGQ